MAMEKRKPHYDLAAVKIAVQQRGADAFTLDGSRLTEPPS